MLTCNPKRILYDVDKHPRLTGTFIDVANPTLLELELYYWHDLNCENRRPCEGDQIVRTDQHVLATLHDDALVRSVDDTWCPRIDLGLSRDQLCNSSCNKRPHRATANEPFVFFWGTPHGFDRAHVSVTRQVRQSIVPAALTLVGKSLLPRWITNLLSPGETKFQFDADYDVANDCGVSEPITLPAGWYKVEASMERDLDRDEGIVTKTKRLPPKYIRIQ